MESAVRNLLLVEMPDFEMSSFQFALINLTLGSLYDCITALKALASKKRLSPLALMWINWWLGEALMRQKEFQAAGHRFARIVRINNGDLESLNLLYFVEAHKTYAEYYERNQEYMWAACHWRRVAALAKIFDNYPLLRLAEEHLKICEPKRPARRGAVKGFGFAEPVQ